MICFIEQIENINRIKKETRGAAVQNFNWSNNIETVNKIFESSMKKSVDIKLKNKIVFFENKRFPFSNKFSFFYRLKFLGKEFLKKVLFK